MPQEEHVAEPRAHALHAPERHVERPRRHNAAHEHLVDGRSLFMQINFALYSNFVERFAI